MNDQDNGKLVELLRKVLPPVTETELRRDLWPAMLRALDTRPVPVPWYDWALGALLAAQLLLFPEMLLVLLYHL